MRVLNPRPAGDPGPKTIVITGLTRGGTSFPASICRRLGVPMGRGGPRYEHGWLSKAVAADRWDLVEEIIQAQDQRLDRWGWKLPRLLFELERADKLLTRPAYVLVYRNILSASLSKVEGNEAKAVAKTLSRALGNYGLMTAFAARTAAPVLLWDHERASADPVAAISLLAGFCGVEAADPAALAAAVAADGARYREDVRVGRASHIVDGPADPALDPGDPLGAKLRVIGLKLQPPGAG